MKHLVCLDNGGETFDRFTILDTLSGDMIGASEQPFHPLGFGQYCGNVAENYYRVTFGYGWRKGCTPALLKKRISHAVYYFLKDCAHVGKRIDFDLLPKDVQQFALQSFTENEPA
jgi:hypothetical protein